MNRLTILITILFVCVGVYSFAGPNHSGGGGLSTTQNTELLKIDSGTTDGLAGTSNSLAYRVHEIEKHFHNSEVWYGAAVGDGFLDSSVLTEFQVVASNTGFDGTALQISNGDEIESGSSTKKYDLHEVLITATSAASKVQKMRFVYGTGAAFTENRFVAYNRTNTDWAGEINRLTDGVY